MGPVTGIAKKTESKNHSSDKDKPSFAVNGINLVRFEVFTALTMKNGVFWDVTPCGFC
jgi:hypothetical protein